MKILCRAAFVVFLVLEAGILTGCSSDEKVDGATPDGAFSIAEKYRKDERYEDAIQQYNQVKNKHPYSRFAVLSEMAVADIQFDRENYPEAEAAYRIFKELHPTHERSDYVTFRLAQSLYFQLPSTIDRDLSLASKALIYFDEVVTTYSRSQWVDEAKKTRETIRHMLAEKEKYVADFYFKQEQWLSALGRYEEILNHHADQGFEVDALLGATLAAYRLKETEKSKLYFKKLLANYPNSDQLKVARRELSDGF